MKTKIGAALVLLALYSAAQADNKIPQMSLENGLVIKGKRTEGPEIQEQSASGKIEPEEEKINQQAQAAEEPVEIKTEQKSPQEEIKNLRSEETGSSVENNTQKIASEPPEQPINPVEPSESITPLPKEKKEPVKALEPPQINTNSQPKPEKKPKSPKNSKNKNQTRFKDQIKLKKVNDQELKKRPEYVETFYDPKRPPKTRQKTAGEALQDEDIGKLKKDSKGVLVSRRSNQSGYIEDRITALEVSRPITVYRRIAPEHNPVQQTQENPKTKFSNLRPQGSLAPEITPKRVQVTTEEKIQIPDLDQLIRE